MKNQNNTIKIKLKKGWPGIVFLLLGVIPLLILTFIIFILIINSKLAVSTVGLGSLFSTQVSGVFSATNHNLYGLIPAIWGTILLLIVCMIIAIPVSLAMAVFASEFTLGFLGKGMRMILGILGGIPSVIYALMSVVFAQIFIIPKFCGTGIPADKLPVPINTLPFNTSTLLGGIMLSMLIIPFLAPLYCDAIEDVPKSQKEASLGLGASRWYTLWNVTIPHALSGITSASTLGVLKAMGDVVIVGLVIGFGSSLPNPLFDIFKATPPLSSAGAGFMGGFTQSAASPLRNSVAYFTAFLLLFIAIIFLVLIPVFQKRFKRRFSK